MTYLRRLELRFERAGIKMTANAVMDEMKRLYSLPDHFRWGPIAVTLVINRACSRYTN